MSNISVIIPTFNESLNIIKESITKSIRKLLPFQQILHNHHNFHYSDHQNYS